MLEPEPKELQRHSVADENLAQVTFSVFDKCFSKFWLFTFLTGTFTTLWTKMQQKKNKFCSTTFGPHKQYLTQKKTAVLSVLPMSIHLFLRNKYILILYFGVFPGGSDSKEPACNVGDLGSIPGSGRSPGEGNGNPLQYSCLENSVDGGAWGAVIHGVAKSQTRLSD